MKPRKLRPGVFQRLPDQPHIQRALCPWCKRVVVLDEARKVTSHEAPVCAGFQRLLDEMRNELGPGAARPLGEEILEYGEDDGEPS